MQDIVSFQPMIQSVASKAEDLQQAAPASEISSKYETLSKTAQELYAKQKVSSYVLLQNRNKRVQTVSFFYFTLYRRFLLVQTPVIWILKPSQKAMTMIIFPECLLR